MIIFHITVVARSCARYPGRWPYVSKTTSATSHSISLESKTAVFLLSILSLLLRSYSLVSDEKTLPYSLVSDENILPYTLVSDENAYTLRYSIVSDPISVTS